MQIHQILTRPSDNTVIVLYMDAVGNRNSLSFDIAGNAAVAAFVAECQQRLPADNANPAKPEILQEINNLQARIAELKTAIGAV